MSDEQKATVTVEFSVQYRRESIKIVLPVSATLLDLKRQIEVHTQLPPAKQRILFNAPVAKDKRRESNDSVLIRSLLAPSLVSELETSSDPAAAKVVRLNAMLIGSTVTTASITMNSKAAAEVSRLSSTTVEQDGRWYRCCYSKGYLRQTAYVCRTCIEDGRADPAHAICLACAEVCHGAHEVEEWGVRYCMRCDCCTLKCWKKLGPNTAATTSASSSHTMTSTTARVPPPLSSAAAVAQQTFPSEVKIVTDSTVAQRMMRKRKRSRSSSPLTPKRTSAGNSPMSGIRVAAVANGPSPFACNNQTEREKMAVTSPMMEISSHPPALQPRLSSPMEQATHLPSVSAAEDVALTPSKAQMTATQQPPLQPPSPSEAESANASAEVPETEDAPRTNLRDVTRCVFVIDSETSKPPAHALIPPNRRNRYPRDRLHWCFCKDDHPTDDPDCGGIVCLLCTTCYWSVHMTQIHSEQYRRMPCYGDVVQGDTIAFRCHTCDTLVCTACRYRCHKDHDVDDHFIVPSREDGTDNDAPPGVVFSCGCRGLCSIAESVPLDEIDDPSRYVPLPPEVAIELMNSDVFSGVVCGACMQEHPWLASDDPRKCWGGKLPDTVTEGLQPIVRCGETCAADVSAGVFPYHGMLLPVNAFTEDMTCGCPPCRAAFDELAPRALEDATEMVVELHDHCDHCRRSIMYEVGFMCQTCEMTMECSYILCRECNAMRKERVDALRRVYPAGESPATPLADGHTLPPPASDDYDHDLSHVFLEDTYENLTTLFSMQVVESLDEESRAFLNDNWEAVNENVNISNTLTDAFGQTPISFDNNELKDFVEVNTTTPAEQKKDDDSGTNPPGPSTQ